MKLHKYNRNKTQLSRDIYETDSIILQTEYVSLSLSVDLGVNSHIRHNFN